MPPVDAVSKPGQTRCKALAGGRSIAALHTDKITFQLLGHTVAASPADQPQLDQVPVNDPLDIKVKDDPLTVADLKGKLPLHHPAGAF